MTHSHRLVRQLRRGGSFTLACLASSSALALEAPCVQWNVSGTWTAVQSNHQRKSKGATLDLQQTGTKFKGSAQYKNDNGVFIRGPVVGTAVRNAFQATVYWDDKRVGVYTGEIGPEGLPVGRTFDKNDPKTSADWHADRAFDCLTVGKAPMALGRVPSSAPPSVGTTASVCDAAQAARGRNSPAAPGLERQCRERTAAAAPAVPSEAPLSAATKSPVDTLKSKSDAVLLNPQPLPPKSANATLLSATKSKTDAVLLNPQPLPPKNASATLLNTTKSKTDAVLLNPQPLPPSALTPTQVPSALR